jgi:hypothetical protein
VLPDADPEHDPSQDGGPPDDFESQFAYAFNAGPVRGPSYPTWSGYLNMPS